MKTYKQFMEGHMHKTCPKGEYYCYTDKKCKKIPTGYHIGKGGYLEQDDSEEKNGSKDSSNGSNGGNGNGNGGNGGGE